MKVLNLRPGMKPELCYTENGDLYVRIVMGDIVVVKLVPSFEVKKEFDEWVVKVVPGMTEELFKKHRISKRKKRGKDAKGKKHG